MQTETASPAFTKKQRVAVRAMGADWKWNWDECVTIVSGKPMSVSPTSGDWYLVKFDDGGQLHIHETQLSAVDQRLPAKAA